MAKPKSMKLRTLLTLRALLKYSDASHRMNTVKLNEHLKPYNLQFKTGRSLSDTVRILREVGLDVQSRGEWENQGIWIENRPLPEHELRKLIFAVSTNPHLSKQQATEILRSLTPFVTVYQEHLLQGLVDTVPDMKADDGLYWACAVIQEAITTGRRVRYTIDYTKFNSEDQSVVTQREWATLFTPKCIYQANGTLYMVGYNNTDRRPGAVNLKDIATIKIAFKHKDPQAAQTQDALEQIIPEQLIPGKAAEVVYEGPVLFHCRGQYIQELYNRFGPPGGPVIKDKRCRTKYPVSHAVVTSETLHWLSQIPEYGIRILGPSGLIEAVQQYYANVSANFCKPLPCNKVPSQLRD